jgi:hypothetical protein
MQLEEWRRTHPNQEPNSNTVTTEAPWKKAYIVGISSKETYVIQRVDTCATPREHPWSEVRCGRYDQSPPPTALDEFQAKPFIN